MDVLRKRWWYLSAAVIILLFMGIAYAFSLFVVPIEQDLGFTRAQTSLTFTLCFIFFSLGSLVTGFLIQKFSASTLLKVGAMMIGFGFCASTFVSEAWQMYLTYSVLCGFSIGLSYNVSVSIIPLYFHDKLGLATGILLMGFAMSTTIFGPLCEVGLSMSGWKAVFLTLGIAAFIIMMIGSFIIHTPYEEQKTYLPEENLEKKKVETQEKGPKEILKTPIYYVFVLIYILFGGIGMALINHSAPILQEDLHTASATAAWIVSFVCMFNGIGRVVWGIIFDKVGGARVLKILGGIAIVAMGLIVFSLLQTSNLIYAIGCALALFCYGGSSSLAPIIIRALFGDKYFSMNFAITNVGTMILSCVPTLAGALQIMSHSYLLPCIVLLLFALLALLFSFVYQLLLKRL